MPILSTFCTTLTMDDHKDSSGQKKTIPEKLYYLLSDCLPEDKTLRDEIRRAKLVCISS